MADELREALEEILNRFLLEAHAAQEDASLAWTEKDYREQLATYMQPVYDQAIGALRGLLQPMPKGGKFN